MQTLERRQGGHDVGAPYPRLTSHRNHSETLAMHLVMKDIAEKGIPRCSALICKCRRQI